MSRMRARRMGAPATRVAHRIALTAASLPRGREGRSSPPPGPASWLRGYPREPPMRCRVRPAPGARAPAKRPWLSAGPDCAARRHPRAGRPRTPHPRTRARETLPPALRGRACPQQGFARSLDRASARSASGGQARPALGTAARQDRSTGACSHTNPKAVRLVPPPVVGLEGALGHGLYSSGKSPAWEPATFAVYVAPKPRRKREVDGDRIRKTVKSGLLPPRVRKPDAIVRRASRDAGRDPGHPANPFPTRVSTYVERFCG